MSSLQYIAEFGEELRKHGSWLYDEKDFDYIYFQDSRFNLQTFFDPLSDDFINMSSERRQLILKELFYCGIKGIKLDLLYHRFCIDTNKEDLYAIFNRVLNKILEESFAINPSEIDIHNPNNWYFGKADNPPKITSHEAIIRGLERMDKEAFDYFKIQNDLLLRKRLTYSQNLDFLIASNPDSKLDQLDEELLKRADLLPSDMKERYGEVGLLVEDILDDFEPERKEKRIKLAETIYKAVEELDLETLKELDIYKNKRIEHFVDIKTKPKEWLYNQINYLPLKRELCKLRGIEFYK